MPLEFTSLLLVDGWKCKTEYGAATRVCFHPETSAMGLDDRLADRKPNTHAGFLGGHERFEEPWQKLLRHAMTCVGYHDFDHGVCPERRHDKKLAPDAFLHYFERITEKIDEHLLDLHRVDKHICNRGCDLKADHDAVLAHAHESERA